MKPSPDTSVAERATLLLCGLLLSAGRLVASDVAGDWEFAGKYLGDFSYSRLAGHGDFTVCTLRPDSLKGTRGPATGLGGGVQTRTFSGRWTTTHCSHPITRTVLTSCCFFGSLFTA